MIPTNTNVSVQVKSATPGDVEGVAVFIFEGNKEPAKTAVALSAEERRAVGRLIDAGAVKGKAGEIGTDLVEAGRGKVRRVIVVGLGTMEKLDAEGVRQAAAGVARAAGKQRLKKMAWVLPAIEGMSVGEMADAIVTGWLLASFNYGEYKGTVSRKAEKEAGEVEKKASNLTLVVAEGFVGEVRAAANRAQVIADGQNIARTIASRPGNNINPPALAKVAQGMARELKLGCRVLDEKQMAKLGMGGILAVGSGSIKTPPRMIVVEYKPGRATRNKKPLLVVGKAITFDTGGISIKPADKMGRMVYDKCGGVAVLGLMYILAKLKPNIHVVGILSSAENHISESAYRPGDIIRLYNGVTVEVTNTDAEGRLVLGDALAWGIETYKPAAVIDLATLTGGVVVALGKTMAGVMSNSDSLVSEIELAAKAAGEKVWRLPVGDDQRDLLKSDHADIINAGSREASPLQGAAFLSYFVPMDNSVPWAHVDIAGVADSEKDLPLYEKGATGWGVRTLAGWVMRREGEF